MGLHWSLLCVIKWLLKLQLSCPGPPYHGRKKEGEKKEIRVILITLSCFVFLLLLLFCFFTRKANDSSKTSTIALKMLLNCWIRCMRANVKHLGRNHENLKKNLYSNCLIFVFKFLFPSKIPKFEILKDALLVCFMQEKNKQTRDFIGCNATQRKPLTLYQRTGK